MRGLPKRIDDALHSLDRRYLRRRLWLWRAADWKTFRRVDAMTNRAILIGGCGRSGTTVLNGLLSCHPDVQVVDIETSAFCQTAYRGDLDLESEDDTDEDSGDEGESRSGGRPKHRKIPSWAEAVDMIVETNLAARSRGGGGSRGRGRK